MNRVWLVSALCLALLGCEEDDTVSATIGAEGGSLVSSDGKVTLQVPEGALASPTTFTIAAPTPWARRAAHSPSPRPGSTPPATWAAPTPWARRAAPSSTRSS